MDRDFFNKSPNIGHKDVHESIQAHNKECMKAYKQTSNKLPDEIKNVVSW